LRLSIEYLSTLGSKREQFVDALLHDSEARIVGDVRRRGRETLWQLLLRMSAVPAL